MDLFNNLTIKHSDNSEKNILIKNVNATSSSSQKKF